MDSTTYNRIVSFIWGIADDCLRDVYVRGKYRDVILPMTVIRRLDAVLEDTKEEVLEMKKKLTDANIVYQNDALCNVAGQSFCNSSPFKLKDLTSRTKQQTLKTDFITYLDGFSDNVIEILSKFKFRNQIDTMIEADILGAVIEKFVDPTINLSPDPVLFDDGSVKLPGLDNHTMGVIFEELIRRFNEENNEEAGEHFTPRDVVELMADVIFTPIADQIHDATYSCYDGACGTGGMLTIAEQRLMELAKEHGKTVSIPLFGQEVNPETYAISKADLLIKGDGEQAKNIYYGSTLSNDGTVGKKFDFMISNPPYGKTWKTDAEKLGGKKDMSDPRFIVSFADDPEFSFIPRVSDGQMLFLANNISKMKTDTELGSRIAEIHNGSSLFTGDAEQGESNLRRYIIENDMLEAIIALPENIFYNTGIATYIWILTNRKAEHRKGKVQLIDATSFKKPLRKNLGKRNCEIPKKLRNKITKILLDFESNEYSQIFDNSEFGYYKIIVERPLRLSIDFSKQDFKDKLSELCQTKSDKKLYELMKRVAEEFNYRIVNDYNVFISKLKKISKEMELKLSTSVIKEIRSNFMYIDENAEMVIKSVDKKSANIIYEADSNLTESEQVPFNYEGGIKAFFKAEVLPFAPDAWIDDDKTKIGYELSFTKYFFKPISLRNIEEIIADIKLIENKTDGLLREIIGE